MGCSNGSSGPTSRRPCAQGPHRREPDHHARTAAGQCRVAHGSRRLAGAGMPDRASRPREGEWKTRSISLRYLVEVGEDIALRDDMRDNTMVLEARNVAQSRGPVPWLELDRENFKGRVMACSASGRYPDAGDERATDRRTLFQVSSRIYTISWWLLRYSRKEGW